MNALGWLQLGLVLGLVVVVTKPLGVYLVRVLDPEVGGPTFLDRFLGPLERAIYRVLGVDPTREQTWKQYAISMIALTGVVTFFTYALLRLQNVLPLNPQHFDAVRPDLAFNTAVSFVTNSNWQSYSGETTMSQFSQMVALVANNFVSPAIGIATAAALVRGIARSSGSTIGNFWRDLVRQTLYLFLPASILYALFLIAQGIPQNFSAYTAAHGVDGATQSIVQGPIASQIAIKMLGTNGGGYVNVNAAHPFENPNALSNVVEMVLFIAVCSALTYYLGRMVKNQRHGWAVWASMFGLMTIGIVVCWWAEVQPNPHLVALGVDPASANMEGKEVRFGIAGSSVFAAMTTATGCGAVNAMHDSFTPIGGLVTLANILSGEVIFGSVGSGLYGMLVFVIIAIFVAGLMIGRTPDYLGKMLAAREVKLAALAMLVPPMMILVFTAAACVTDWGTAGLNNGGPHGFSEMLYAYASASGNNGSAFAGLTATPSNGNILWNLTLGICIIAGRLLPAVSVLALAGSLVEKKTRPDDVKTFPVAGLTFVFLVSFTVVIVGLLAFFPAIALGPLAEHFSLRGATF
jgi:K+-transporting ATPase ATPase A chain